MWIEFSLPSPLNSLKWDLKLRLSYRNNSRYCYKLQVFPIPGDAQQQKSHTITKCCRENVSKVLRGKERGNTLIEETDIVERLCIVVVFPLYPPASKCVRGKIVTLTITIFSTCAVNDKSYVELQFVLIYLLQLNIHRRFKIYVYY